MNMQLSAQELQQIYENFSGLIISVGTALAAAVISSLILPLGIRGLIFKKAGQKGWKSLIPFVTDYTYYKIAWSGKVYVILLLCSIVTAVLGAILGTAQPEIGLAVGLVLNIAVAGAKAIASMMLQFKMAHAFGKNDYFAVGLYFLSSVFTAILAFGNAEYQGAQKPEKKQAEEETAAPARRVRPVQSRPAPSEEMPQQPVRQQAQSRYAAPHPQQDASQYQRQMNYQPMNPQQAAPNYAAYQQPRAAYPQQPAQRARRTRSAEYSEQSEE